MRAKLGLSLLGLLLAAFGCQRPQPMPVELPVTKTPERATNEELLIRDPDEPRTRVAVAPKDEEALPEPKAVNVEAVGSAKPQAAKTTTQPSAPKYAGEQYRLVSQPDEIVSVLKNGLTVIAKRVPSPVLAVRGYVRTGGVYEGKWLGGGLSHLLEHLVAGGSSQRRTEAENRDLLQRIGNDSNAYTTQDHTAYYINTTADHLDDAVNLVTGWLFGALITEAEYKREYQVVQRELEKDKGEPDWIFYELAQANRYRVSPARVPTIGYQAVIQGLSRDDVFSYYKETYQPNNIVFVITGDKDPEKMLASVQRWAGEFPPGRVPSRDIAPEPPVLTPRTTVATFPKLGQAKLQLAYPSVTLNSPDLYALDLLSTILGGGESSILVEELRDKRQLVSAVSSSNPTPDFVEGSFEVSMELAPEKITAATEAALELLDEFSRNGVSEDRLGRAKTQMRASRVKGLQTSESVASSLAGDLMNTGDPHFTDVYLKRIEAVTAGQIKDVADRYFVRERLLTTALLPAEYVGAAGLPKAVDLLRPGAPTTTEPASATTQPTVTRAELPNGAILLHKRIATSPLVVVRMYSLGGVTAEDVTTNGLGNLTMEMLPRGTKTRSAQQIAEFFDSIGGDLETSCGNNSWSWAVTCLKDDLSKAMEVLGDVVNNPIFPEPELATMKLRIGAQIESQDADWHAQAMRFFKREFFGPKNSPYQFLPIGTKANVATFTTEQAKKWYTEKVLSARRVVAVYGDVELDKAQSLAREHLGVGDSIKDAAVPRPPTDGSIPTVAPGKASVDVQRIALNKTEQPVAGVIIGYDSESVIGDPVNYPLTVADTMSSGFGYPTGYLHEILRGRGLVYVVHAQNWPGREEKLPGSFFVYAGCDPDRVNEVVDLILENIARLQGSENDTQPGWFGRSKQLITTSDAMDNETPSAQATTAALDELNGLGYDYHDKFSDRINAVTLNQVRAVSGKLLKSCVVTVSTPAPDLVKVKTGVREYKEFPEVDLTPRGVQHDSK